MARRARYKENHASFGQFIMSEQAMMPTMQVAQAIKGVMRQTAPHSSDRRGQPYADSFAVKTRPGGIVAGKYRNRRVAATIANTADHAPPIEFGRDRAGWRQDPPRRVMLKAGLKFGDTNKMATAAAAAATLRPVRIRRDKR